MNKSYLSLAAIIIAVLFMSCSKTDLSTNSPVEKNISNPKGGNITTTANPVIANIGVITVGKGKTQYTYNTIAVANADGSNQTNLYYSGNGTTSGIGYNPGYDKLSWSPSNNNISFLELDLKVKKLTVTVVNNVPTASNITDLVTYTASDSVIVRCQQWSPSTSISEIAYSTYQFPANTKIADSNKYTKIMGVSANGGTPYDIYTEYGSMILAFAWNYDGSKLAVLTGCLYGTNKNVRYIKIIERSSGNVLNTYNMGITSINYLSWSASGLNKLTYIVAPNNKLYTFDLDQAIPSPVQISLASGIIPNTPSWTPDNSKIIFYDNQAYPNGGVKTVDLSSGTVTLISNVGPYPEWKR